MQTNHIEPRQSHRLIALSIAFVLLNILNLYLTLLALGSDATELKPIMRLLLSQPGWVFCILVLTLALIIAARKWPMPVTRILTGLVIATAVICLLNLIGVVL